MKIKTRKIMETYITFSHEIVPEGDGWQYDGNEISIGTGEEKHFWLRDTGTTEEVVYTLKYNAPKGNNWTFNYTHIVGKNEQKRYIWSRPTKIE